MKITFLGSGTSSGVPSIGCRCATCRSTDTRDKRLRPSIWLEDEKWSVIIDTSSDFRQQCLRADVVRLDAVVYTHHHFDHIAGFDDLRAYNFLARRPIPIYVMPETLANLKTVFSYAFGTRTNTGTSVPVVDVNQILDEPFAVAGIEWIPLKLSHGKMRVNGYRVGSFAYCTDCNAVTPEAMERLAGVDVLVLDALRISPHPTHFNLEEAIAMAQRIGARETYFTHIAHEIRHAEVEALLPPRIYLAYDGLQLTL
ncbi:MAG: MBL fold metallo-hydrolase [Bacteroidetes bacterium]|nr:MBL fold metallo-hydrolase [Bacteroidota bacterium]